MKKRGETNIQIKVKEFGHFEFQEIKEKREENKKIQLPYSFPTSTSSNQ